MRYLPRSKKIFALGVVLVLIGISFILYSIFHKPTILFIPGLDLEAKDYETLQNSLKDEGYTVLSYEPNYHNPSDDAEMVVQWAQEVGKFIGKQRVIVIGHSVGGATAAYFCATDDRCIAGINLDGGPAFDKKIPVPFLYLQGEVGNYCDQECLEGRQLMEKITKQSGTKMTRIPDIKHYNFTDLRTKKLYDQDYLGVRDGREEIVEEIKKFLMELN